MCRCKLGMAGPCINNILGPPVVLFGEGSTTKIGHRKRGTLSLTPLLEDLGQLGLFMPRIVSFHWTMWCFEAQQASKYHRFPLG